MRVHIRLNHHVFCIIVYCIIQDCLHLEDYAKSFGKIPVMNGELDVHDGYLARLGVTQEEAETTPRSLDNLSYTSYMLRVPYEEGEAKILTAILSCAYSYEIIAKNIVKNRPAFIDGECYDDWIGGYAFDDYAAGNVLKNYRCGQCRKGDRYHKIGREGNKEREGLAPAADAITFQRDRPGPWRLPPAGRRPPYRR